MRRAIARISLSVLGEFLGLSEGCHVYGVLRTHEDHERGTISLYLQGEELPDVDPDNPTPQVRLVYEKDNSGAVKLKAIEKC